MNSIKNVLIIEDTPIMADTLMEAFRRYNEGRLQLPRKNIQFDIHKATTPADISNELRGTPKWDVIVIDRRFPGHENMNCNILLPLCDLYTHSVIIVWTAYGDERNVIECMRLGAWDYIHKKDPQRGDTCTDVIMSVLEGIEVKEIEALRAKNAHDGQQIVIDNYGDIYSKYKGQFVAFKKDQDGQWLDNPEYDSSLFRLYMKLQVTSIKDTKDLYIQFIQE